MGTSYGYTNVNISRSLRTRVRAQLLSGGLARLDMRAHGTLFENLAIAKSLNDSLYSFLLLLRRRQIHKILSAFRRESPEIQLSRWP